MIFCMAGTVFANDLALEANKTAEVTDVDTATVNVQVNGSSESTQNAADVVFAIDSSGSMSTSDPTDLRKTATINFINKMNNNTDKVGVINWDDAIQQRQNLTSNFTAAINVVNQGSPGGTTNGALAMQTAKEILDGSGLPVSQRIIIFLTDGLFNEGGQTINGTYYDPDQAAIYYATQAKNLGYSIYTIGLGSYVNPTVLQSMASVINGTTQYYFASNATVLDSIYNQIFQTINKPSTNITVTDFVPNYLTYVDGSATVVPTSNVLNPDGTRTLTWFVGSLGKGQTWNVSYDLISGINGYDIPTNVNANVTYTNPSGNPENLTLPIPLVDFPAYLDVTKVGNPDPVTAGNLLSYLMTIKNTGPNTAWDVSFSDTVPAALTSGVEYSLNGSTWNAYTSGISLGDMTVGQTATFYVRGIVDAATTPGNIINTVNAYLNGTLVNSTSATNTVAKPVSYLVINKVANPVVLTVGQLVTFTITVTNYGPDTSKNTFVQENLPNGLAYQSYSATMGTYNSGSGKWTIGDLDAGNTATLYLTALVQQIGSYMNTATVGSDSDNPNIGNSTSNATVTVESPVNPSGPSVEAAGKTIPLQKTGLPVAYIALAVLMLVAGYVIPKRK